MRYAIPSGPSKTLRLAKNSKEWPLALRFALMTIPAGALIALIAVCLGYFSSSSALRNSLESVPLLEAKIQADSMKKTLSALRGSLSRITKDTLRDKDALRDSLDLLFHDNAQLIHEIGFKDSQGNGYLLLRDSGSLIELSLQEASQGPYSPFQQIGTLPVHQGNATLYPPVYFDDPNSAQHDSASRVPVMRMAYALPDGSGTAIIGISLPGWRNRLAALFQQGSPLRLQTQSDAVQLSFYFDIKGWILFEMDGLKASSFLPDLSREGYSGDLGRAGYDAAFRPWAIHDNFWRMVTEAAAGRSGSIPAPADKYTAAQVGSTGLLCYAPVLFAPSEGTPEIAIGGIAFFETSSVPLFSLLRFANYALAVVVGAIALFLFLAFRMHKSCSLPMRTLAQELRTMSGSGDITFVKSTPSFNEQNKIVSAVNSLIAGAVRTRNELDEVSRKMRQARERLPVDLTRGVDAGKTDAEFGLVGSSSSTQEVRHHVHKAARAGTDVLVWGETGTGKELVAAAIHKASSRHAGPYLSINCGALDENLLLDTLFGHVKGAFSEAKAERKGAFLAADGGTLHLDEIANASFKVQQALLRALSVRKIRPLGSDEEVAFDVRVVAATNVDLRECVRAGTFREDLYYRLAIISIETPPLRHRKEDIPELAAFCIRDAATALGRREARLSRGALDLMYAYDWPGNVREFKNCLTRAMAFVEGDLILPQHITLEQDAFRTYAKPVSPEILAERISQPPPSRQPERAPQDIRSGAKAAGQEAVRPDIARQNFGRRDTDRALPNRPDMLGPNMVESGMAGSSMIGPDSVSFPAQPFSESGHAAMFAPNHPESADFVRPQSPIQYRYPDSIPFSSQSPAHVPLSGDASEFAPFRADSSTGARAPRGNTAKSAHESGHDTLNERQIRALELVKAQGSFTRAQYEAAVGSEVSSRTAQNDLRELVERGMLKRMGAGPGTRYAPGEA